MRKIELEVIRLLKQSDKSTVLLVREIDGEQLFVQKELQGRHEIYETLKSCSHSYLPNIYEADISDDVTVVLEEFIDGKTLDSATLTEKQICTAIKELCVVLGFLHEKGIIHRDVKPSNIIMSSDGHIRLIDFDIARMIKDNLEQDTKLLGTRGYAPPEQFGFAQTDARADIYSLGVTIKQLLGEKAKKARYKRIIRKCTSLNPNKRYQSVKAVKNAFSLHHRGFAYISAAILVTLLSWRVAHWIPLSTATPEVSTQKYYPTEDLLFYTLDGEYIIDEWDAFTSGDEYMQVDMTGKGDYSDFIIPYSMSDGMEQGLEIDMSIFIDPLADGLAPSFWIDGSQRSLWTTDAKEAFNDIPHDSSVLSSLELSQITCVDADSDGIKELFVSKGNREHAVVTLVWKLADIKKKHYEMVGMMWGTDTMYLYPNGDIRANVNGNQLNHYNYADGVLTEISVVNYNSFKIDQIIAEEDYVKEDYSDWIYDDITRGYRLEED